MSELRLLAQKTLFPHIISGAYKCYMRNSAYRASGKTNLLCQKKNEWNPTICVCVCVCCPPAAS